MKYKRSPRSYFIIRKDQALKNKTKKQTNSQKKMQMICYATYCQMSW